MKLQEDLATLFDKQMNMGTVEPPETPEPSSPASSQRSPITYSITQHYHHSAHIAQQAKTAESGEAQSSPGTHTTDTLRSYGIDSSTLSPGQIELFENAIPEQKSRLIQIWQICPETNKQQQCGNTFMEDSDMDSIVQDKGRDSDGQYAEPYMVSGYEILAQRDYDRSAQKAITEFGHQECPPNEPSTGAPYKQANDPIFQSQRWWEHAEPQPMEHQYGAFEYMNQHPIYG